MQKLEETPAFVNIFIMFVTWQNNQFKIHEDVRGTVMYAKNLPEKILDAQLSGSQLVVTTPKHTFNFRRIGKTYAFTLYRSFNH